MNTANVTSSLAAEWTNPTTKQLIIQRIRAAAKGQIVETNDSAIAQQYYRMWLQVPTSSAIQRLIRHPLLTVQDKKKIDEYVYDQQKSQIKSALTLTGAVSAFYWIFLSRTSFFQNIFNNRQRRPIFNIGRKILALYAVFLGSMFTMNSHYQKKIPNGLHEKGMFQKYKISYMEKFV